MNIDHGGDEAAKEPFQMTSAFRGELRRHFQVLGKIRFGNRGKQKAELGSYRKGVEKPNDVLMPKSS